MNFWTKYAPSILLFAFVISLYAVPALISGYRKLRRAREFHSAERRKIQNVGVWWHNEHGEDLP